jgi:hypothetical protein
VPVAWEIRSERLESIEIEYDFVKQPRAWGNRPRKAPSERWQEEKQSAKIREELERTRNKFEDRMGRKIDCRFVFNVNVEK